MTDLGKVDLLLSQVYLILFWFGVQKTPGGLYAEKVQRVIGQYHKCMPSHSECNTIHEFVGFAGVPLHALEVRVRIDLGRQNTDP